jgi:hypothetical protein
MCSHSMMQFVSYVGLDLAMKTCVVVLCKGSTSVILQHVLHCTGFDYELLGHATAVVTRAVVAVVPLCGIPQLGHLSRP